MKWYVLGDFHDDLPACSIPFGWSSKLIQSQGVELWTLVDTRWGHVDDELRHIEETLRHDRCDSHPQHFVLSLKWFSSIWVLRTVKDENKQANGQQHRAVDMLPLHSPSIDCHWRAMDFWRSRSTSDAIWPSCCITLISSTGWMTTIDLAERNVIRSTFSLAFLYLTWTFLTLPSLPASIESMMPYW